MILPEEVFSKLKNIQIRAENAIYETDEGRSALILLIELAQLLKEGVEQKIPDGK